jgi:hypothetical protein
VISIVRSGNFEGVTIGSTKADAMEQILLRQRQGTLDRVALIDDLGVLVAQEAAGGPLTVEAVQRIGHADHWYIGTPVCSAGYETRLPYGIVFLTGQTTSHCLRDLLWSDGSMKPRNQAHESACGAGTGPYMRSLYCGAGN